MQFSIGQSVTLETALWTRFGSVVTHTSHAWQRRYWQDIVDTHFKGAAHVPARVREYYIDDLGVYLKSPISGSFARELCWRGVHTPLPFRAFRGCNRQSVIDHLGEVDGTFFMEQQVPLLTCAEMMENFCMTGHCHAPDFTNATEMNALPASCHSPLFSPLPLR